MENNAADIINIGLSVVCPVMTKELFSRESGLRFDQIRGHVDRGNLPIFKVGKHKLLNLCRMTQGMSNEKPIILTCPIMTAANFADICGLTEGQIETQLELMNLPSRRVGRLVLVDLAELYRRCKTELTLVN